MKNEKDIINIIEKVLVSLFSYLYKSLFLFNLFSTESQLLSKSFFLLFFNLLILPKSSLVVSLYFLEYKFLLYSSILSFIVYILTIFVEKRNGRGYRKTTALLISFFQQKLI